LSPEASVSATSIGTLDADEFLRHRLFLDAGRLNEEDEGRSRTVENWQFGGIEVDEGVVDTEAGERRHQVFDGAHSGAAILQTRAHARIADQLSPWLARQPPDQDRHAGKRCPVSGAAGRRLIVTLTPECRPTPAALDLHGLECSLL
jgi:hypothetical protein